MNDLYMQVMALNLINPTTGYDVNVDDVASYMDDTTEMGIEPTKDGFEYWLNHGQCVPHNKLPSTRD